MATLGNIPMKKMMSQIAPKHMLDNKILLKLEKNSKFFRIQL